MHDGPPDILAHIPICTLVIVAVVWTYLEGDNGVHNRIPQQASKAASPKTLARYLSRAKTVCLETQQAIREDTVELGDELIPVVEDIGTLHLDILAKKEGYEREVHPMGLNFGDF